MTKTTSGRFRTLARKIWSESKKTPTPKTKRRRAFLLELLENRQLMAGDITGTVFNDLNANGVDDPVENGLPGWTVFVDTNNSGTYNPGEPFAVTDVDGKYGIAGVPAGTVTIYEVPQDGFAPTPGFTDHQSVSVRDNKTTRVKFPNVTAPIVNGTIVGTVFEDDNENLTKDSGEHGLVGWTMFIDTNGDGSLTTGEPTAVTDADGDYLFADVPAGLANVYEVPAGGFMPTVGGLFPTTGASTHHSVSVVAGTSSRSDFANAIPQVGTITGNVWSDVNGDGLHSADESAMAGITVYVDLDVDGVLDANEPSRVSDASGAYAFTNIRSNTYVVRETLPASYISAANRSSAVTTTVFRNGLNAVDFFNLIPTVGSIGGVLWDDIDGNGLFAGTEAGIAGWEVFIDRNLNGSADAGEPKTTTDAIGQYAFSNVPYGFTDVRTILPPSWFGTNPLNGATRVLLLNGQARSGLNFGVRENVGNIHGNVWNDLNGDGLRGADESGIASRTVYLDLNKDGSVGLDEPSAITNSSGDYTFNRVPVGTYAVTEVVPSGWISSVGKASTSTVSVVLGGNHVANFYNLVPVPGSVSGVIFTDLDGNGTQSVTDPGLEGWQVYADLNNNNALDAGDIATTTDATGNYTLTNVPYGNVSIHEVVLAGYTPINHPGGKMSFLLLNGENRTGITFANKEPVDFTISGMAFFDSNKDGIHDPLERGLSGITVYLDTNNNGSLDAGEPTTITSIDQFYTPTVNEAGTYSFSHLARGTYHVREIVPAELDATPSAAREQTVSVGPAGKADVDFANVYRANEIRGFVFDDTDADHVRDPGEHNRAGVSIYIDLDRDDVHDVDEPTTISGDDGSYAFLGLTPGAYIVRELSGAAGPQTYPTTGGGILWPSGTSHAAVGNVTPSEITTSLTNGQSYTQTVSLTLPNNGGITNLVDVFLLFDDTGSFTANSPIVRAAFPTIISQLQSALPGVDLGFGVGRLEEYGSFAAENATGRPFILNQPIVASSTTGFSTSIQSALDRMAPGYGGDAPETDIEALFQVVTGLGFDGNNNGTVLDSGAAGLATTQLTPGTSGDVPSFASFRPDPTNNVLPAAGSIGGAGFRAGALPIILTATDTGFAYQPKGETSITGQGGLTLPLSSLTQTSRASTPFASGAGIQETITGLNALGALVVGLGTNPEATVDPRLGLESLARLTGAINQSTSVIPNGTPDPIAPGDPLYFQIGAGFGSTVADGITNAIQNAVTNVAMDITIRASDPRVKIINHTGTVLGVGAGQTASFDIEFIGDGRPHRFDLQFVREGTNVVVGSIPVVLGTPVVGDGYSYEEFEDGEVHHSSHFGNYVANVAPSFVAGANVSLLEDAGPQSTASWATSINAGAAWESAQTLDFITTNDNPSLFSVQPTISADGTLSFTPAANQNGVATVVVQLHDNGGVGLSGADTSAPQTFVISVAAVNDAPVAGNDLFTTTASTPVVIPISALMSNDSDVEGDALTFGLTSEPAHGQLAFGADGSFLYTPDTGFTGNDSFTYVVNDGSLNSNVAVVTIAVTRVNSAPVVVNDAFETNEDTQLTVAAPGVLANDSDAQGDALTVAAVTQPTHGVLSLNSDGSFTYTPDLNFSGTDSFTYTASDGDLTSVVATVNINVIATNRAPVSVDDSYTTTEDSPLSIAAPGVLSNDSDVDHDTLSVTIASGPSHGSVTLNADGSFVYTPAANYSGADSFTYVSNDGSLNSNIATVSISVTAVNDAPLAGNDAYSIAEDNALAIAAPGVMVNDSDVDSSSLTPSLVSGPSHGTLAFNADGSLLYTPNTNYNGADAFTYTLSDGELTSALATVAITVTAVNDAPIALGNSYNTNEDTVLSVVAPGVLGNDSDVDGTPLQAARVTLPAHGTLTLAANGSFVYTPAANFNGIDTFTYRASDGLLSSNIATVTISVAAVNDAPVAVADSYSTDQNVILDVPARGLLNNDTDVDGDVLTASVVTGPTHGTLTLNADGSFRYTPATGYNGLDSFTYRAADALSSSAVTTVSLTIVPPPPPSAKFFVVDADRLNTYQYAANGSSLTNTALNKSDSKPRGIASNSVGTIQWVVDQSGSVFVYDKAGTLLGQWTPQNVGKPEGITVWGNNLWIVDPTQDRVFYFAGGANLRSGRVSPTSSFALNSANLDSTDVVTDGSHLWVVNNTLTTDRVFRYSTTGLLEGSWSISAVSPTPTGITLDPNNVNHIWIVDASTDRVYQYDGATSRITGAQEPSTVFQLAAANTNAQGIADPLVSSSSSSVQVSGAVPVGSYESMMPSMPTIAIESVAKSSQSVVNSQTTRVAAIDSMLSQFGSVNTTSRSEANSSSFAFADHRIEQSDRLLEQLAASRLSKKEDAKHIDDLFADLEIDLW